MKNKNTMFLVQAAAIGAIYVVLTLLFAPLSYGEVQVRFSEALTILPYFTQAAIPELFVGCILSDLLCCRYHFRKYCNTDRCNFYLQAARCQQMACTIAANRRQRSDRTFRSLLRIWCKSSDPADDADRRCRRSHFLRNLRNDRSYRTFQSKRICFWKNKLL